MSKFRIGDKVRCLQTNSSMDFIAGEIYEVAYYVDDLTGKTPRMGILKDSKGMINGWCQKYFELINNVIVHQGNQLQPRKGYQHIVNRNQCKDDLKEDFKDYKQMYNLSQDEIDAIIKEIQDEQKQQQFQYTPQPFYFSNDTWKTITEPNGNVAPIKTCQHEMIPYTGLFEQYNYCKICGQKE